MDNFRATGTAVLRCCQDNARDAGERRPCEYGVRVRGSQLA